MATTDEKVDDIKWDAYANYIQAYHDYRATLRTYKLWSLEERASWTRLMQARKAYKRARKL